MSNKQDTAKAVSDFYTNIDSVAVRIKLVRDWDLDTNIEILESLDETDVADLLDLEVTSPVDPNF